MQKLKTFYETQIVIPVKEIVQRSTRSFLSLWNKNLLTEIYKNIHIFDFTKTCLLKNF